MHYLTYANQSCIKEGEDLTSPSFFNYTLKVCSNYQLQTVRPTILTGNYPLTKIKNNLTNGAIISFDMTSIVRKELSVSINYIRQKGYDFLTLSELLSEEMK